MEFALSFWDLCLWLAFNAAVTLATSEVVISSNSRIFAVDKKRLRMVAVVVGFAFMFTVLVQFAQASAIVQP